MLLVIKIAAAFIALGVLIFVHESGHFLVAKAFGVRVLVYSFGFGKRILGFRWGGTDYRLSIIPFGGYVRLWGADPFEVEERDAVLEVESLQDAADKPQRGEWALQDVSVWKRLLIYAAGPAANLVVPFFVFAVLLMAGEPQNAAIVGTVVRDSPAAEAGVLPGDQVLEVAGTPVVAWSDMDETWMKAAQRLERVPVVLERLGERVEIELPQPTSVGSRGSPVDFGLLVSVPGSQVGVIHSASPAGLAGIRTGDELFEVAGQPVDSWSQAYGLLLGAGDTVQVAWRHDEQELRATLQASTDWVPPAARSLFSGSDVDRWGLHTATLFVDEVSEDSAAAAAGIRAGDFVVAIDGRRVLNWHEVLLDVRATLSVEDGVRSARMVDVTVMQADAAKRFSLQPEIIEDTDHLGATYFRPVIGVVRLGSMQRPPQVRVYYPFGKAIFRAGTETVLLAHFTVQQIGRIATGRVKAEKSVGGPIEIARQATIAAELGIFYFARLLGMISISVGIFNLLPVPVLDGGHLLFYGLEAIRGRPVSALLRERAQIVGVMLLVALMIFVLYLDVGRWFNGGS